MDRLLRSVDMRHLFDWAGRAIPTGVGSGEGIGRWVLIGAAVVATGFAPVPGRAAAAQAQDAPASLTVQVVAGESGTPLVGAFLTLFDAQGNRVRNALTDANGRYAFTELPRGAYAVSAELIGRAGGRLGDLELRPGMQVTTRLELETQAFELPELVVQGTSRCEVRPTEGEGAATLWQEARKALEVARWALDTELYRYELERRERELGPEGRRIVQEQTRRVAGYFREPFTSRAPEELARTGYIQRQGGDSVAVAPDAAVLLSDPFLDAHCFRVRQGDEPGRIGLAFEPLGPGPVTDISGVLWFDARTTGLREVDYRYVASRGLHPAWNDAGGSVAFERLPSGAWVVRSWHIRMPIFEVGRQAVGRDRIDAVRLGGFWEVGGELLTVRGPNGEIIVGADRAALEGQVYDSLAGAPVRGVTVFLDGTAWSAVTDDDGRFRLSDLPEGPYLLRARPLLADQRGVEVAPVDVELVAGRTVTTQLSTVPVASSLGADVQTADAPSGQARPGAEADLRSRASPDAPAAVRPGAGVLVQGVVRSQESGEPLEGAIVRIPGVAEALSDPSGRFSIGGVPAGRHPLEVEVLGRASERDTIDATATEILHVELRLEASPIRLPGIEVVAEARSRWLTQGGFYDRREVEQGAFIDRETIEAWDPPLVTDLFTQISGAQVFTEAFNPLERMVLLRGGRGTSLIGDERCFPSVWLDGILMHRGGPSPTILDHYLDARELTGVEVYRSTAEVPAQFSGPYASCGVIVLWTGG